MKKIKYIILCGVIAANLSVPTTVSAYSNNQDILASMSIMTYIDGDFNENDYVTRGMMATILVMSSPNRDYITTSNISPFYDVPHTHWSAPYVSSAVSNGMMGGYLDGSFKADNYIKTEEAITGILNLLGYTDFGGTYPSSQMSLAKSLGLLDGANVTVGNNVKRGDIATIIYNALNTNTKEGSLLIQTLGYETSNLALSDVLDKEFEQPDVDINTSNYAGYKIYVDGNSADSVPTNSLVYVNDDSRMVFAYTEKISGVITEILPNKESPETIIISSKEYVLSTDTAKSKVSLDGYDVGDYATFALDRNGEIGDVMDMSIQNNAVGVLLESGVNPDYEGNYIKIVTSSGDILEYPSEKDYSDYIGDVFEISNIGDVSRKSNNSSNVEGTFDSEMDTIGNYDIAANINIIDVDEYGQTVNVSKDRMDNIKLSDDDILYEETNENGEITSLILNDVTNDTHSYGYMLDVDIKRTEWSSSTTYEYDLNGNVQTKTYSHGNSTIKKAPVKIEIDEQNEYKFRNLLLADEDISEIYKNQIVLENGETLTISDNAIVYKETDSDPVIVDINDIDLFSADLYYDKDQSDGGAIRVIYIK